jgi:hypothetical protein
MCSYNMLCCIPFIGVDVQLQYVMLYTVYWSGCAVTICYAVYHFCTSQLLSTFCGVFHCFDNIKQNGCFRWDLYVAEAKCLVHLSKKYDTLC